MAIREEWTGYTRASARLCVGKGWEDLINEAFDLIDQYPDIGVADTKEKWGGLRLYLTFAPATVFDQIEDICERSYKICEFCGKKGKRRDIGWIKTLCLTCYWSECFYRWWNYKAAKLRRGRIWRRLINKNK